ncbi:hypothetical protein CRM22_006851 [Opisthorchis felineus]|uniref:MD-2-related lipid-recognition domain-containing protein n=1 Tax=Opisthorchis felineus TaxID=147828 RepID=A0A4S2LIT6_OPIFE|nr:hypothetical protein CRM22_006851 [Opisthorchis felineus]TGZ63503.1 hypothetical protein CRM22_006851 [Opisthorchis felineus]TGZ63504.1 hypothetical protein CRM22_006851 [Opisthorchis felineus]
MQLFHSLLFSFMYTSVFSDTVEFSDCGSVFVKPLSVDVNGCSFEDGICNLKRGTTFGVHIKFQSDLTITATGATAEGKFDGNYLEMCVTV